MDFEFRISERKRLILWRVVVGTPIETHSRIRILAIDAVRILYRNFNDIGVRSFILIGAPFISLLPLPKLNWAPPCGRLRRSGLGHGEKNSPEVAVGDGALGF